MNSNTVFILFCVFICGLPIIGFLLGLAIGRGWIKVNLPRRFTRPENIADPESVAHE